jgi:hypothetical protein
MLASSVAGDAAIDVIPADVLDTALPRVSTSLSSTAFQAPHREQRPSHFGET